MVSTTEASVARRVGDDRVVVTIDRHPTDVTVHATGPGGMASAVVTHDDPDVTDVRITLDSDHVPPTVKRHLVESLFSLHMLESDSDVEATLPLGDVELLHALRQHFTVFATRAAGSSCLVSAHVQPDGPLSGAP